MIGVTVSSARLSPSGVYNDELQQRARVENVGMIQNATFFEELWAMIDNVIVDEHGFAMTPKLAKGIRNIEADIAFIREDGWMCSCPLIFEPTTQALYRNWKWVILKVGARSFVVIPWDKYKQRRAIG